MNLFSTKRKFCYSFHSVVQLLNDYDVDDDDDETELQRQQN